MRRVLGAACLAAALLAGPLAAQEEEPDPAGILEALLGSLLGFTEVKPEELERDVAEVGGIAFRASVPLHFMTRAELTRYLEEVLRDEYPEEKARADQRTLVAFDLIAPDADLRGMRARLLEDNIVGFYDERPDRRKLYAVSDDRRLTPANQLVMAHELRHALQDQYLDLHRALPDEVGDFDDRRLALISLLEGDATLVMERYLVRRLPGGVDNERRLGDLDLSEMALPGAGFEGVPTVLQAQLVMPYLAGRDFAMAVWKRGGWDAVRAAWSAPPRSTEQVLHPEKFFAGEAPEEVVLGYRPDGGTLVKEGVLGELMTRSLLGAGAEEAARGWGGDRFAVWDVHGRTLLVWASSWDTAADRAEFLAGARARFAPYPRRDDRGFSVFTYGARRFAWGESDGRVILISADEPGLLEKALAAFLDNARKRPG